MPRSRRSKRGRVVGSARACPSARAAEARANVGVRGGRFYMLKSGRRVYCNPDKAPVKPQRAAKPCPRARIPEVLRNPPGPRSGRFYVGASGRRIYCNPGADMHIDVKHGDEKQWARSRRPCPPSRVAEALRNPPGPRLGRYYLTASGRRAYCNPLLLRGLPPDEVKRAPADEDDVPTEPLFDRDLEDAPTEPLSDYDAMDNVPSEPPHRANHDLEDSDDEDRYMVRSDEDLARAAIAEQESEFLDDVLRAGPYVKPEPRRLSRPESKGESKRPARLGRTNQLPRALENGEETKSADLDRAWRGWKPVPIQERYRRTRMVSKYCLPRSIDDRTALFVPYSLTQKPIGQGAWGVIHRVCRPLKSGKSDCSFVVKQVIYSDDEGLNTMLRDIYFLYWLNEHAHPKIAPRVVSSAHCPRAKRFSIVMDKWDGDLGSTHLNRTMGMYTEAHVLQMFKIALELDKYGIVHGDLKPNQFLYSKETKEVVLTDFGFAGQLNDKVMAARLAAREMAPIPYRFHPKLGWPVGRDSCNWGDAAIVMDGTDVFSRQGMVRWMNLWQLDYWMRTISAILMPDNSFKTYFGLAEDIFPKEARASFARYCAKYAELLKNAEGDPGPMDYVVTRAKLNAIHLSKR